MNRSIPKSIFMLLIIAFLNHSIYAKEKDKMVFQLWSGKDIPNDPEKIPFPKGIKHITIHDARESDYKFLHGAAIINYKGTFFANWANSPINENYPNETMQGRRTKDPMGKWSELEVIAPQLEGLDRHSHGVYLEHKDRLWTFAARFGIGAKGKRFSGLKAEAFVLNEETDKWESKGIVMDNCWPYDEPVLMDNGNYITAGQDKDGLPVIAYSNGDDLTKWTSVLIPYLPGLKPRFGETTVWAEGNHVLAVIRGGEGEAWVSVSEDFGKTWTKAKPSNYPMVRSKAYLGKLSTGQLYMISNFKNRDTLVISVGKPGEMTLSKLWRIRHGSSAPIPRFKGAAKAPQWSYPYAYEHDGKLYVVYSIGKEDCGLSVIPIKSLKVKNENNNRKQSMNKTQPWPTGDPAFAGLHSIAGHPMAVIDEKEYKQYINSFAVSQKGTWLISVTSGGVGYAKVYVKRSENNGKTWSKERISVYDPRQDKTLKRRKDLDCEMGQLFPVPKTIGDKKVYRIYQFSIVRDIKKGARFGKLIYTISEDDGKTWVGPDGPGSYWNVKSPTYDIVGHNWGWHLMAPPRITSDGHMILPMNASTDPPSLRDIRCEPVYMSSKNIMTEQDPGKVEFTFNPPPPHGVHVPIEAKPKESHGMEAQVVELSDGRLFSPMRTANGCIYFTTSKDGGKTWSEAIPLCRDDDGPLLLNPNCAVPLTKLSNGSYALLHCNNDGNIYGVKDVFKHNVVRHPIYVSIGVENKSGSTQPIHWSKPRLMTTLEDYKPKHRDGWNDLTYGLIHEQDGKFYHFYNAKWDRIQVNEINPLLFLKPGETPVLK